MIAAHKPIGRFIALANLDSNILSQKSIEKDIANLVDLIIIRVKDRSIDEVANSLLENVFDLRFDLIQWFSEHDLDLNHYTKSLTDHISVNLQFAPYSSLAEAISSVLLVYGKIVSPMIDILPNSFKNIFDNTQKAKLSYDMFNFFTHHPSPQVRYLKNWVDASLKLEIGLILADLILTGQVQMSKKRIKSELVEFLYNAIIRFGSYSIFTGFWTPDSNDTSNLTNSMEVLAATLDFDNNVFYPSSKEEVFAMINN